MMNSTAINGSKANSVNKRSLPVNAQHFVLEALSGETTANSSSDSASYSSSSDSGSSSSSDSGSSSSDSGSSSSSDSGSSSSSDSGSSSSDSASSSSPSASSSSDSASSSSPSASSSSPSFSSSPSPSIPAYLAGSGEEEEEEEEEEEVLQSASMAPVNEDVTGTNGRVSEGVTEKRSISMTLTHPDVLGCPICFLSLTIPVFQCKNGHIACSYCFGNFSNCPSCSCQIENNRNRALEKVIESMEVRCPNASYGCNVLLSYSELRRHEPRCIYSPCSCPLGACKFLGFSKDLYSHFSSTHNSAEAICFDSPKPISLKTNQRFLYLREKFDGTIFVVNRDFCGHGSAVNVICIAPGSSARRFTYELVAIGWKTSIKLESEAENIPNWNPSTPLEIFLLVPRDIIDSCGQLRLEVCIKDCSKRL